ncbi:MAG: amidohydrolase family protein [Deltaproteobacteria bacterium]|nr:amidohydrolase family protein [Deltaproteobacteria bacterium]
MLLKSPQIITMAGDVILNGAVRTEGDQIVEIGVGVKATKADATIKLEDCILLPGLVNTHSHLDLSCLAGKMAPPTSFADWVRQVIAARTEATDMTVADGLREALQQCYRSGITCVGDHVGHLGILPFLLQTPLKGRAFLEIVGPTEERGRAAIARATEAIRLYTPSAKRMRLSMTPHAAYSVHPIILRELLRKSSSDDIVSIHCAESAEEWECFSRAAGPLYDLATSRGLPNFKSMRSPTAYLAQHGSIPNAALLIHCNYVDNTDLAAIKAAGATIVHCPQSHRFFGAAPFPMDRFLETGIAMALGTDSLASAASLNMLTEMQMVKEAHPELSAQTILAMATTNGAAALRMADRCGAIVPGLAADLIAARIVDTALDPYENVLRNTEVPFVVMGGRIVRNVLKGEHGI